MTFIIRVFDFASRLLIGISGLALYLLFWAVIFAADLGMSLFRFIIELLSILKLTLTDVLIDSIVTLGKALNPRKTWDEFSAELLSNFERPSPRDRINAKQEQSKQLAIEKAKRTLEKLGMLDPKDP